MRTQRFVFGLALAALVIAPACGVDTIPQNLRDTPPGTGPIVRFDTAHRPLPDIPIPNDFATYPDPSSRTGRRINVSTLSPTGMETIIREAFNDMEGWGTSQPIWVAFNKPADAKPNDAAIDLEDFASRMQNDEHDLSNDPVYLVNLSTGVPMFLDAGNGYYPVVIRDPFRYFPNDPKAGESNLSFETVEEGAGLTQADYRPALDMDFDGTLDHPNFLGTVNAANGGVNGVDNLLTWYERETDTLVLRPILPLDEKTEYAVVLTDRLIGYDHQAIRSPFDAVYHPSQEASIAVLQAILGDKSKSAYYGDIAGSGLDHVAFAWTFTTQPTFEDMKLLRDGLYGKGPFSYFQNNFPTDVTVSQAAGQSSNPSDIPNWQSDPTCAQRAKTPFVVKPNDPDVHAAFDQLYRQVFGFSDGETAGLETAQDNIDHIVIGTFQSPFLLGDPASTDPDTRFHVDFTTGAGDVRADTVPFFLAVPKARPGMQQPFPVTLLGHGVTGHDDEVLIYAGDYNRQGIAVLAFDMPEHGIYLDPGDTATAQIELRTTCLVPFLDAYQLGRAHDLNGDGIPDSGWFWWTTHIPHTRDNVRQGLLDAMQTIRVLRSFDGVKMSDQDFNADGKPDLAGDFDGDGTPDIGGPNVPYFATGESLGSIMAEGEGAVEPYIIASSSAGGGGGSLAMDVAFRSYGVVEAVTAQMMTPLIFAVPASERPDNKDPTQVGTQCTATQRTVRVLVNDGDQDIELEVACLDPTEIDAQMTVVVTNTGNKEVRCARTGMDGRFRISVPSTAGDKLDIQVYNAPDAIDSYKTCNVLSGAPAGRRINTWEQAILHQTPVADPDNDVCTGDSGCAQFRATFFPVGSDLVAPNDGLGLGRQTPDMRRLRDLAQAGFDAADPINYAPYYMERSFTDENGQIVPPRALLAVNTVGDNFVEINAGFTFARAAGALPFLPPSALTRYPEYADYVTPQALYDTLGEKTPMQSLIDNHVVEGVARLGRTAGGSSCAADYSSANSICTKPSTLSALVCADALYDPDYASEGAELYAQPHPTTPLRLARLSAVHPSDDASLAKAWEPRLRGVPFAPDATAWSANARVVGVFSNYIQPQGVHTWDVPDACRAWDYATYGNALIARFFSSGGKDLYYLSHPSSHECLQTGTCDFLPQNN